MSNITRLMTKTLALITSLMLLLPAHAQMTIEIVGGGNNRHAIAVVPFKGENHALLTAVISNDLNLSGMFRVLDTSVVDNVPFDVNQIRYPLWQDQGAQSLAIGQVEQVAGGQLTISFRLMDVAQQKSLTAGQFTVTPDRMREVAHTIANMIYEAITGQKGFFHTKIAYILKSAGLYQLQVSDVDGARSQTILRSHEPLMSPAWSPNGRSLAYVSFESRKPVVWVQDLASGARRAVANFKGSNSAPAWSPDGQTLAVVLTTPGNSQIYLLNVASGSVRRLSHSDAIDTEPAFTPDGSQLLFVSDRAGEPQIYSIPTTGGTPRRLTWEGNYNVSPTVAPDGKSFAYVRRVAGQFRVVVQQFSTNDSRIISDGPDNARPSFSPNGLMVLYASDVQRKSVMYAVTPEGSSKVKLAVMNGDIRDPVWGPFNNP